MANEALKRALRDVIEQVTGEKNTFDSHEIITRFMKLHERDYIELLNLHLDKGNSAVFRETNSKIALAVSRNASALGLKKRNKKVSSLNIKGYKSKCACWDVIR